MTKIKTRKTNITGLSVGHSKGDIVGGWKFVKYNICPKSGWETDSYWTKEIKGHKVWRKKTFIRAYGYHNEASTYHVDGTRYSDGTPVTHAYYKDMIKFIDEGCTKSEWVWCDEADDRVYKKINTLKN